MNAVESPAIQKTPNVCGGNARIRNTRIPVWSLVLDRRLGMSDDVILTSFPALTLGDLDAAWNHYRDHPVEIEQLIWLNDTAANVPEGAPVPAAVIISGRLLGLDDATVCDAFDPPLLPAAVAAAWAEYRADPRRIGRELAALRLAG